MYLPACLAHKAAVEEAKTHPDQVDSSDILEDKDWIKKMLKHCHSIRMLSRLNHCNYLNFVEVPL